MIKSFIWAIVETQIARWETKWPMQGPQLITYQFTRSFYISEGLNPHAVSWPTVVTTVGISGNLVAFNS